MKYAPYSFTKINCFKSCPKQFDFRYIDKIAPDDSYVRPQFFERGSFVHKYLEHRLSGGAGEVYGYNSVTIDDKMYLMEQADKALEAEYVSMTLDFDVTKVENWIAFDFDFLPTVFNKYDRSNALICGSLDYYAVEDEIGVIIDWKSGKFHDNPNYNQLELYALWVFQSFPNVKEIDVMFYYIESENFNMRTLTIEDVIEFREKLANSIEEIECSKTFDVKPSKSCEYCEFLNTCKDKYNIEY